MTALKAPGSKPLNGGEFFVGDAVDGGERKRAAVGREKTKKKTPRGEPRTGVHKSISLQEITQE